MVCLTYLQTGYVTVMDFTRFFSKIAGVFLVTGFCSHAYAQSDPDWTPFLKSFENACKFSGDLETFFNEMILIENDPSDPMNAHKIGKLVIPEKYKSAISPEGITRTDKGDTAEYSISVTSGTYHGLKVQAITAELGIGQGFDVKKIILNISFNEAKQRLKKVKFMTENDDVFGRDIGAHVGPLEENKTLTVISCDTAP